jgi:hypothetical protein
MLFSAHVVNTGVLAGLRRKTPQAADVEGLLSARTGTCAPFTSGLLPRPQLGRELMVASWDNEAALDHFLDDHATGRVFRDGWQMRMELILSVGVWPGLDERTTAAAPTVDAGTGPTVAITIGTAYLRTVIPFARVNSGLEDQFLDTPSGIWGTAFTNLPQRLVGTLTIWESIDAATDYMRSGAHGAAVAAHYDPRKDPTGHTYVTGGGFFGLRPISTSGSVDGKNEIPAGLLAV